MAPVASSALDVEEETPQGASEKIREEQQQIVRVQEWWDDGRGPAAAARSAVLSAIDPAMLSELVAAGGGYHTILSADRLDGMHRRLGSGTDPALEPLRKALQTRGGAKSQARVVGMLLFREARALYEHSEVLSGATAPGPGAPAAAVGGPPVAAAVAPPSQGGAPEAPAGVTEETVSLDEQWSPPRRYVCSEAYPEGAQMAARAAPNQKGEIVATLPASTEYLATGRIGEYLQIGLKAQGTQRSAYVLHTLGDLVLLVPAGQPAQAAAAPPPADATTAVALEESWSPPRRYVCAETYPAGAQMAVRAGPTRDSQQVATLPAGTEYFATGRVGDYLQVNLQLEGGRTTAYVLHRMGDLTLLVPNVAVAPAAPEAVVRPAGSAAAGAAAAAVAAAEAAQVAARAATAATDSRVDVLEATVAQQERQIRALQTELAMLRSHLGAVAIAFRPIAIGA